MFSSQNIKKLLSLLVAAFFLLPYQPSAKAMEPKDDQLTAVIRCKTLSPSVLIKFQDGKVEEAHTLPPKTRPHAVKLKSVTSCSWWNPGNLCRFAFFLTALCQVTAERSPMCAVKPHPLSRHTCYNYWWKATPEEALGALLYDTDIKLLSLKYNYIELLDI